MKTLSRFVRVPLGLVLILLTAGCPGDPLESPNAVDAINVHFGDSQTGSVNVGEDITVHASIFDADRNIVDEDVQWSSSNPAIATVRSSTSSDTYVTGVSAGTVTISAKAGGVTGTAQLTVTNVVGQANGIVFSSARDGNSEIYLLDESGAHNLTQNAAADITPTKSSTRIYFSSNRSGNYEIYSMKFDGTDVVRLTNNPASDYWPSVAGNGVIVFSREVSAGKEQIFTMNALGQNQTNISANTFNESFPAVSPDGSRVAYASDRNAKFGPNQYPEVYVMNIDGTGVTRLTNNDNGVDYQPAWSPDGATIAFASNRPENPYDATNPSCYQQALDIWIVNANGTGLRNLSNTCRGEAWPSWSPSGTELVFASDRGSSAAFAWDLWKMPAAGGTASRVTTTGKEATPVWR